MRVKVFFPGILADWIGERQIEVDLPEDGKLAELLTELKRLWLGKIPAQLWDEEKNNFKPTVWALRGKERVVNPQTPLKEGEEIIFILGIAGG